MQSHAEEGATAREHDNHHRRHDLAILCSNADEGQRGEFIPVRLSDRRNVFGLIAGANRTGKLHHNAHARADIASSKLSIDRARFG